VNRWRNARERGRNIERDCEWFAGRLNLVRSIEGDGHGRWILKGGYSWAEVVTLANGIYVGGDVETVVFQGGPGTKGNVRAPVWWMATTSYTYARQKATMGDTAPDEFDEDCARGDIIWYRKEDQLTKEQARALWDLLARGDVSQPELGAAIYEETHDGELCGMGVVVSRRVYLATAILRRLEHLLKCQDLRVASRGWFRRAA
jgi:hypothetical protein